MTKYEKVMVRDAPLVLIDIWRQAHAIEMENFFGIKWIDPIYIFRGQAVESWRPIKFFQKELPVTFDKWLAKSEKNEKKLLKSFTMYWQAVNDLEKLGKAKPPKTSSKLISAIRQVRQSIRQGLIGLIPAYWFLVWQERFSASLGKDLYKKEIIDKAMAIRKQDSLFDDGVDIVYEYFDKIAKIKNWSKEKMKFFTFAELSACVKTSKDDKLNKIFARQIGYVFIKGRLYPLKDLNQLLLRHKAILKKEKVTDSKIIKGIIANKGKVKGVVKVVFNRNQMSKVNKGDILVASMTTPSFLLAMRKAAAFVTDEGGLTSHAAILAREMNKPCLIGTRIATQVLRDRERVEVDADKGLVRKL